MTDMGMGGLLIGWDWADGIGDCDKVGYGELLGPLGQEAVGDGREVHSELFEGIAEGFAPLVEAYLDHLGEKGLIAGKGGHLVAAQADDGRFDLGRRIEDMLVDGEEVFDIVEGRQQDTEDAVGLAAGLGGHALGHLLLEHAHHLGNLVAVFVDLEENLRRDIVREIAYDGERLGEELLKVELEEVALDDMEGGIMVVEVGNRLGVNLDGVEVEGRVGVEIFGEHPHAGTDFQHMRGEAGETFGYLLGDLFVLEEMLS